MSFVSVIVTLVVVWWLVFFIVLPIGVKTEEKSEPGHASSAPKNPRMMFRVLVTTVVTLLLTGLYFTLLEFGYLDFIQIRER